MSSQQGSDQSSEHNDQSPKHAEGMQSQDNSGSNYAHRDVFNHHGSPPGINQGYQDHQGHQGQQAHNAFNPIVGSGRTLGARRGTLPTPIAPPARRSPLHLSPHSSLLSQPLNLSTPTRSGSGYLEHITSLRFPNGQRTPSRRLSFPNRQRTPSLPMSFPNEQRAPSPPLSIPPTPNLAFSRMHITAQGSGDVSDNSSSEDNGGVSTIIGFQDIGGASMGVNSHGNEGVSVPIDSHNIGAASMSDTIQSNAGASMNDTIQSNVGASMIDTIQSNVGASMNDTIQSNVGASMNDTIQSSVGASMNVASDDAEATPRGIPSQVQLPVNRQLAMNQPFVHQPFVHHRVHGGGGLRRMSSNPVMASRPMYHPAPGVGPVHMPSHQAPTAPAPPAVYVDPVNDEVNEFFNTLKIMILEAVQVNRYKNGLFVTSITPRTDLVNDMTIMINSAQVTGLDNMRLQNVRAAVEEIKRKVAAGDKISMTIAGKKLTIYDFYGQHVGELRDILLSRDKHEHARWLYYYGGGGNDNEGGSGSAVA